MLSAMHITEVGWRKSKWEKLTADKKGARAEVWKPVVGYEGYYEVSNMGRVRSVERRARFVSIHGKECTRRVRERILKQTPSTRGRLSVMLSKGCEKKRISVHRLVAQAFCENPFGYDEVNHKDENPLNNRADNLEWCSRKNNMTYGTILERIDAKRKRCPVKGVNETDVVRYDAVRYAKKDGFDPSGIYQSVKQNKKYKGYYWSFI